MDLRKVKDLCSRAKSYAQKGDTLRALTTLCSGLKELTRSSAPAPSDMRGLVREVVQSLSSMDIIKETSRHPFKYEPGQERALLLLCEELAIAIDVKLNHESYEMAAERKLKLDQTLNRALRTLEQGQIAKADEIFSEALVFYRDEHRVFTYIAKALMNVGAIKRAQGYVRRGLAVVPGDAVMLALMDELAKQQPGEADNE
jgi:tetratricopeptide (TPR) repeat protein